MGRREATAPIWTAVAQEGTTAATAFRRRCQHANTSETLEHGSRTAHASSTSPSPATRRSKAAAPLVPRCAAALQILPSNHPTGIGSTVPTGNRSKDCAPSFKRTLPSACRSGAVSQLRESFQFRRFWRFWRFILERGVFFSRLVMACADTRLRLESYLVDTPAAALNCGGVCSVSLPAKTVCSLTQDHATSDLT